MLANSVSIGTEVYSLYVINIPNKYFTERTIRVSIKITLVYESRSTLVSLIALGFIMRSEVLPVTQWITTPHIKYNIRTINNPL